MKVISQCRPVSDIGTHADPGQLLNPAPKARAAEQEAMKLLGLKGKQRVGVWLIRWTERLAPSKKVATTELCCPLV